MNPLFENLKKSHYASQWNNLDSPIEIDLRIYRYVCPNCLRTFLDNIKEKKFCWKCGQDMECIGK